MVAKSIAKIYTSRQTNDCMNAVALRHRCSQDFCLGGLTADATRPMPPSPPCIRSVVFEAIAGSWGSVSAPAVRRIMGGASERNKNSKTIWVK